MAKVESLRPDPLTRKSHALLSAAEREQQAWNQHGPNSGMAGEAGQAGAMMENTHDTH
jgi:hypothetical protein